MRRKAAEAALHWSGAGRAFEAWARPSGAILLMYHSVATDEAAGDVAPANRISPALFERQMAFLRERRRVVALSELAGDLAAGRSPAAGTVCLTFDDGYLDNLTVAAPVLDRLRLPATLYLATGYVERAESQWADRLHAALRRRTVDVLPPGPWGARPVDLRTHAGLTAAWTSLHPLLLEALPPRRRELLEAVEQRLRPRGRASRLTLDWDEVRALRRRHPGIELGGHTAEHVDLRTHGGDVAAREIDACRDAILRETGEAPLHFSFPYARWSDETRSLVAAAGWRTAVGDGHRLRIDPESDRFALPRVSAPGSMGELAFKTSGAYPGLLEALRLG